MVTKGIIKTIDFNGNTCVVRVPFFETATNRGDVEATAIIATVPGVFNGYKENDVVLVAFEDNKIDAPVVIGKLYLGAAEETAHNRGSISCGSLDITSNVSIPITTKLTLDNDPSGLTEVGVDNDLSTYKSIADIARHLQQQETKIGSINAQIIDDGENLGARVTKVEADDIRHEAEIIANAEEISTKVSTTSGEVSEGLGWNLTSTEWNLTRYYTDPDTHEDKEVKVLEATKDGLKIEGEISATTGEIGGFKIESDNIHSGNKTSYDSDNAGVYIGNDGIGLGANHAFYVTASGQIVINGYATENYADNVGIAARTYSDTSTVSVAYQLADKKNTTTYSLTAPEGNKEGDCWFCTGYYDIGTFSTKDDYVDYFYKDGNNYIKVTESNKDSVTPGTTHAYDHNILLQYSANTWHIISNDIIAEKVTAKTINALNITAGKLTVAGTSGTIFNANANDSAGVRIGGFEVDHNSLSTVGKQPGDANSIMLFSGTNDRATTVGTGADKTDWAILAANNFGIDTSGNLYATSANITGTITSDSATITGGHFGGLSIGSAGSVWCDHSGDPWGTDTMALGPYDDGRDVCGIWFECNVQQRVGKLDIMGSGIRQYAALDHYSPDSWWYVDNFHCDNISGQNVTGSDKNLKKDISYDISKYDYIFDELRPASFKYINGKSNRTHLGFIAQDLLTSLNKNNIATKDFACLVKHFEREKEEDQTYGLRYHELHALEVNQIQKLKARVADLESTIQTLQTEVEELKNR